MKVIEELNIEEFRGIRKLAKPLKLADFNVIIGRNNTGKTAILEALYLLPCPWSGISMPIVERSTIALISRLHGGTARALIYGYSGEARISFKTSKLNIEFILNSERGDLLEKVLINGEEMNLSSYRQRIAKAYGYEDTNQAFSLAFYIPNDTEVLHELQQRILDEPIWNAIIKEGHHRKVVKDIICPTVYDKFTEALIERDRLKLRKEINDEIGPLYIDVADLGEGIERILTMALCLEYLKPKLVLWDDIETAAHPGLLETTLKWLANKPWQVLITTHSIDVLYELTQVQPRECNIIALRKSQDDIVDYRIMTIDEIEELLDKGLDIRKLIDVLKL
ncbi:MAG: hypothetical protein DRN15_09760 [Thermoprotei archaeon]|nr:MAG: hypothetical protein DRN15_09760 [Thermoprotei archaeon]